MGKNRYEPTNFDRARDELFSHIQRCGVLEADVDQREGWIRDTTEYLRERYPDLTREQLDDLAQIGTRYCRPAIPHGSADARDLENTDAGTSTGKDEKEEVKIA